MEKPVEVPVTRVDHKLDSLMVKRYRETLDGSIVKRYRETKK